MHVSDLYKELIEQSEWLRDAAEKTGDAARDELRSRALTVEVKATYLAHCAIKFGDFDIESTDIDPMYEAVKGKICDGRNPWISGLSLIKKVQMELKNARP